MSKTFTIQTSGKCLDEWIQKKLAKLLLKFTRQSTQKSSNFPISFVKKMTQKFC
jgi:hypothetical protein